jgi:hypothetical protein
VFILRKMPEKPGRLHVSKGSSRSPNRGMFSVMC